MRRRWDRDPPETKSINGHHDVAHMANTWKACCQWLNLLKMQSMVNNGDCGCHDGPSTRDTPSDISNVVINYHAQMFDVTKLKKAENELI